MTYDSSAANEVLAESRPLRVLALSTLGAWVALGAACTEFAYQRQLEAGGDAATAGAGATGGSAGAAGAAAGSAGAAGAAPDAAGDCGRSPADPAATRQARNLLCYLQSEYGSHILSGQQESTWVGGPDYEMDYILAQTGRYPALRGLDWGDPRGVAARAISWWNAGGIPFIGYHMGAPTFPDSYEGTQQPVDIDAVLTPGTEEYEAFIQRLDGCATELATLQAAEVAVLWRPFHEAGGAWFWWSKQGGPAYVRLWRFMFNYFTGPKGLHNLVWFFPTDGSPRAAFYPGDAYVDMAGADTYASDYGPLAPMFNAVRQFAGSEMPIGLHENGPIPDPDLLQSEGSRWVLFNTWNDKWLTEKNSVAQLQKVYASDYVITRDELPDLK